MSPDRDHLADILAAARAICRHVEGVSKEAFELDDMRRKAVVYDLVVLGEATKRLSKAFRSGNASLPWRQMAQMRDVLIHAYDHISWDTVWETATTDVPALLESLAGSNEDS